MKHAEIVVNNNQFFISGELHFSNIMTIYRKSIRQIEQHPEASIDMSQVTSSDSSGLALILEWIKFANLNDQKVTITHIPTHLLTIAKAARIDKLISNR